MRDRANSRGRGEKKNGGGGGGGLHKLKGRMRSASGVGNGAGRWAGGGSLSPDDAYLSYHDIRLTREDMQTLKNDWVTDNIIAFWEEYLEREFLTKYKATNIVLLRPSMSFMLLQTPDPSTLLEALPNFSKTTHVFLPINDCRSVVEAEGGTHWSLLLVSIVDGVSFHYDSLPPGNKREASIVSQKISRLLNRPLRFVQLNDSPLQNNSSDCGVFVCLTMRHLLLKRLLMVDSDKKVSMSMGGKAVDAAAGRKEIKKIIDGFRKEGVRRMSLSRSASPYGKKSRSPPRIE